jgi:hypothetical protein
MRIARFLGILAAMLVLVPLAHADGGQVTMIFQGVNGVNDGQYYVSPYNGTMNGQGVTLFCDDILNEVSFNQKWQANVTNLASNDFSQTRYGGVANSAIFTNTTLAYYNNPGLAYQEAAWLTTQFATRPGDYVDLQYALWDLMNPGSRGVNDPDVNNWLYLAGLSANYSSIDLSSFEIVTNTGPVYLNGQVQEFIIRTPEPGTLALLLFGVMALAGLTMLRNVRTA